MINHSYTIIRIKLTQIIIIITDNKYYLFYLLQIGREREREEKSKREHNP